MERNHVMPFVLQLESVVGEGDKAYIERLWKKDLVYDLREAHIDHGDTDDDGENEAEDKEDFLLNHTRSEYVSVLQSCFVALCISESRYHILWLRLL